MGLNFIREAFVTYLDERCDPPLVARNPIIFFNLIIYARIFVMKRLQLLLVSNRQRQSLLEKNPIILFLFRSLLFSQLC